MILFIFGQDTYRSRLYVQQLTEAYQKKYPGRFAIDRYDATETGWETIDASLRSSSLFDDRKFLIIANAFSVETTAKKLANRLASQALANTTKQIIVIWDQGSATELKKINSTLFSYLSTHTKQRKEFSFLTPALLEKWIIKQSERRGMTIQKTAVKALGALGPNLYRVTTEMEKLFAHAAGTGTNTITETDISLLVEKETPVNTFALLDALTNGITAETLGHIQFYKQHDGDTMRLLGLLSYQAKAYISVQNLISQNSIRIPDIVKRTGLHPFVVQKLTRVIHEKNTHRMQQLLNALPEFEHTAKSGGDFFNALTKFIIET